MRGSFAWVLVITLLTAGLIGCKPKAQPTPSQPKPLVKADPQAEAEAAIRELARQVHVAFLSGDPAKLAPLALWGLPEETLHAGMKQVYIVDARISAARIKAVPATNRTVVHTNTLEKLELFLAEPDRQFEPMKPGLTEGVQEFKKQNTTLLTQAAAGDAPDWTQSTAPSIVVRPGINMATPLPEGAADVLFSCAGRSYQLKLNNCVKLPGHGWVLGADIELIDLAAQAEAEKAWTEDFPAAQLRATEQKKRLFVDFTGSDWCPPCIALHDKVLTQPEFLQHAKEHFVLVKVDFPRNKPQADPQREANQILARAYRVQSFPTVLVLEANGTEVQRLNGYNGGSPADFIKSLTPSKPTTPTPKKQ
ncbi:MAG: thioredoxin family protein [Limisphaerales bacterium]